MSTPRTTEEVRHERQASFHNLLGIEVVRAEKGRSEIRLKIEEHHLRSLGIAHGGAVASLMDTAVGMAAYSLAPSDHHCVTIQLNLNYTRAAPLGSTLTAKGTVQHHGRTTAVVTAEIHDENNKLVATGSGTMMYLPL